MKKMFRKIATVASGALMIGASIGMAAAAAYPTPFVSGSMSDVAVVYGANAALSDLSGAASIKADLDGELAGQTTGGTTTVTGGDFVKLERSADKFNLGNVATDVFVTAIDDRHMPALLAKGDYRDADNDEFAFTQKINLGNWSLGANRDTSYSDDPFVGVTMASGTTVLNYTLDFTKAPTFTAAKLESTNMNMFGKEYFVLDVDNSTAGSYSMTLLDSANTIMLAEGESTTVTIGGKKYEVQIDFVSSTTTATTAKLKVNGETTNSLAAAQTYKLSDGSYVGVKEILYSSKETGVSKVEFSIGSGKLKLTNGNEVEMNDETVYGLYAHINHDTSAPNKLNNIVLQWKTDEKEFLTTSQTLTMPGFGNVKMAMTAMNYPNEEVVTVENDGDSIVLKAPIKDGDASLNLLYVDSTTGLITGLGESSSSLLVTTNETSFLYNQTRYDKYFVASWNTSTESESYVLSASVTTSSDQNRTSIKNEITGQTICSDLVNGGTCSVGNMVLTVNGINRTGDDKWVTISSPTSGVSFNTLYTAEGLKIFLPWKDTVNNTIVTGAINLEADSAGNTSAGHNATSWYLSMSEEDKDSNLGRGNTTNVVLTANTDKRLHVTSVNTTTAGTALRVGSTDKYEHHIISDLATRIVHDRSGNEYSVTVTYAGEQAYADLFVSDESAAVVSSSDSEAGAMTVEDSEIDSVKSKNLIVVGGSAINSVAATLLGSAYRESAFTSATGVAAGEYLVQVFASPYTSGKVAMLVAGYNAEDTTKAVTYVTNNNVDTTVGTKLKGTSATSATAVTA